MTMIQPPSGGCVLKLLGCRGGCSPTCQPPSGGCVLKHCECWRRRQMAAPAAFRRLCVETLFVQGERQVGAPAAFRRLCVETPLQHCRQIQTSPSRLQAAVC